MRVRPHRSASHVALALSATLSSTVVVAQELPPPPPAWGVVGRVTEASPSPDLDLQRALFLVRSRQSEEAVLVLARMARDRGVDLRGYDPVAVLFRLADGRSRPGAPTAGALPSVAPAPPSLGGEELPPPPSDELVRARVIDAVVERLARWDLVAAGAYLQSVGDASSVPGREGETLRMLRSLALNPAPGIDPEMSLRGVASPTQLLPDRPAGTIEGFEVLTLYGSTASYGLILGTWAGLAVTSDSRNALRLVLPLAGISAGVVSALVLDRSRSVRRGRGFAVNSGLVLGGLAGTAAMIYAQPEERADSWGLVLAGSTLGIGAALALSHLVDALPGSVNYVTSTGVWGSVVGLGLSIAVDGDRARSETIASGMLIGEGVGIVLGLLSADALKPMPSQSRWSDLGAGVGCLLGASLGAGTDSVTAVGIGMAIGVLSGGAIGWFASRPSESDRAAYLRRNAAADQPLRFGVSPLPGGGMLLVGM